MVVTRLVQPNQIKPTFLAKGEIPMNLENTVGAFIKARQADGRAERTIADILLTGRKKLGKLHRRYSPADTLLGDTE